MQLSPPLGVFGGTFDPIHNGHILPILEAAKATHIQRIGLMPCFIPNHKSAALASSQHRVNMLKLVCHQHPIFYLDCRDINRNKTTVSLDSLQELRDENPTSPLCFFIGSDSLYNLTTWYQWPKLFELCHFVVCQRNGEAVANLQQDPARQQVTQSLLKQKQTHQYLDLHNSLAGHIYVANTQPLTVSSSAIRQQLISGQFKPNQLPPEVINYIQQHKLYQQ